MSRALACVSSRLFWMLFGKQLEEQGNSLPKLEEGLKLALSDRDKYLSLLEQLKTYKQNLQEKIEKKIEEDRMLKVFLDIYGLVVTIAQDRYWYFLTDWEMMSLLRMSGVGLCAVAPGWAGLSEDFIAQP